VLDGFVITAGNADGTVAPHAWGGGVLVQSGSPTIRNCTFFANVAEYGGGAYTGAAGPRFLQCVFDRNGRGGVEGGGMYNAKDSSPEVSGCRFTGNRASSGGGAYDKESRARFGWPAHWTRRW
jgi:hypothetical protein